MIPTLTKVERKQPLKKTTARGNKKTPQYNILALKVFIHVVSLALICELYYQALNDNLGADPVEAVLHFTGIGAFNLLILSLLVTPLIKYFKAVSLMKVRRLLGLYSFSYALCHILSFLAFEVQFDWQLLLEEIIERPYITVGMTAFVILFLLAITSISSIKKLMGSRWQRLHYWIYPALLFIALHFLWSVKSEIIEPSLYFFISFIVLYLRKEKITRWLSFK